MHITAKPCIRSEGAVVAKEASAPLVQAASGESGHASCVLACSDDLAGQDYES